MAGISRFAGAVVLACLVLGTAGAAEGPSAAPNLEALALFESGLAAYREISLKKGVALLEQAYKLEPRNALIGIYLADALYLSGKRNEGNEIAAQLGGMVKDPALLAFHKAMRARVRGDDDDALFNFRESLLATASPHVFYELVALEVEKGKLKDAVLDLGIALERYPNDYYLLNLRGSILFSQKRYTEAVKAFNAAIQANGRMPWARINRGLTRFELGEYHAALEDYDSVLAVYPDQERARFFKALALERLKRYGAAREIMDALIQADAQRPEYWLLQGWLYCKTDKVKDGEALLLKYVEAMPDDPAGHYKLATVYAGRRKTRDALTRLRRALELDYDKTLTWIRADAEWDRTRDTRAFRRLLDETMPRN